MEWSSPIFPDLFPRLTDPSWFLKEKLIDDDGELTQLEHEHTTWINSIGQKYVDIIPIGKSASEVQEEEEEDEDDEDNDDDDTDTHDDEEDEDVEMDVS